MYFTDWCDPSEASGDEQERERKEMSWAEQVDLAYPLEECEFRMQIEKELDVVDGMF